MKAPLKKMLWANYQFVHQGGGGRGKEDLCQRNFVLGVEKKVKWVMMKLGDRAIATLGTGKGFGGTRPRVRRSAAREIGPQQTLSVMLFVGHMAARYAHRAGKIGLLG